MNTITKNSAYIKLNVVFLYGFIIGLSFLLASCANSQKHTNTALAQPKPYKIAIINASQDMINSIKYKPCNSHNEPYQYLTGNLRPAEKFTINIYSRCVDLLATNAFKKKLVDVKNVDLKSVKTWTIK